MTVAQIKKELDNRGISYKSSMRKQELKMLVPEYAEARREKGYLTDRGLFWLFINVANIMGEDKLPFSEREAYGKKTVQDYFEDSELISADCPSPLELINVMNDYKDHLEGKPVQGIIQLDASNQAFQIYGALTSDINTGRLCNLANGSVRADAYQMMADECNIVSETELFNRKNLKKATMTTLYSKLNVGKEIQSSSDGTLDNFSTDDVNDVFQEAFGNIAPEAKEAMEIIQATHERLNRAEYSYTMPDGFRVKYVVKAPHEIQAQTTTKSGINLQFNQHIKIHRPSDKARGLSPNIIHSIDGYILRQIERKFKQFISTIHDSIGVPYNYADRLIELYLEEIAELNRTDLLKDILDQITGEDTISIKRNTLTTEDIMNNEYALA